ncbi:MAG TPA: cobalamin-binding protein [Nitrospiraceae bacterium]|nr:cobalamin-binding protein [Nitrospiraceae bacterium]
MNDQSLKRLINALLEGDQARAIAEVVSLPNTSIDKEQTVIGGIETAMGRLDAKCTVEQFNLLEIMLVGRAVMGVIKTLYPHSSPSATRETVVLASLEGDVHDLGKNVVKTIMTAKGYQVIDCGKDCPVEKLVDAAVREKAAIICISGLITNVVPLVRQVIPMARTRGLTKVKVLAGGAALKQASADALNVDYVADSVFDGIHYLECPPEELP